MALLQFQPLQSVVEVGFWSALGELKLHRLKLQEGPLPLRAHYTPSGHAEFPGFLGVEAAGISGAAGEGGREAGPTSSGGGDGGEPDPAAPAAEALAPQPPGRAGQVAVQGELFCLNSVEQLTKFDRKAAAHQAAAAVWEAIMSGAAEQDPALLQRLVLLTYCDLKHYKFYYWFGFPALQAPSPFTAAPAASLATHFGAEAEQVLGACSAYAAAHPGCPAWLLSCPSSSSTPGSCTALPLREWHVAQQQAQGQGGRLCLAVADCSNLPANPGWPLRNLLLMAAARWLVGSITVVCLRERRGLFDAQASIVLQVTLPEVPEGFQPEAVGGWEANARGKAGPRMADLGPSMDPQQLAASAVELNLRLMRWRAAPSLQVDSVAGTKCLLLGAGTLGCSVARTLLGWGVRHITFVDNSHVAYSNPVRQSLYEFKDCLSGGKPKAQAAAEALQRIFPGVVAEGVALSIPMPGHPIAEAERDKVQADITRLESLVAAHDVVFLLTDTRESRWLPTLLAAAAGKLAINSALGFDGFMVMRHGAPPLLPLPPAAAVQRAQQAEAQAGGPGREGEWEAGGASGSSSSGGGGGSSGGGGAGSAEGGSSLQEGPRLGCYFCNDVVAPINSTVDRSLDQQCTVARPGLSSIAGALAAELMAAVVAHPLGVAAPAAGTPASRALLEAGADLPLGEVPHMIRGSLGGFSQMVLSGQAFSQCTACSAAVVERYREEGHAFLMRGLADPSYLEDLTGLTELHKAGQTVVEAWESDEEAAGPEGGSKGGDAADDDAWEEL